VPVNRSSFSGVPLQRETQAIESRAFGRTHRDQLFFERRAKGEYTGGIQRSRGVTGGKTMAASSYPPLYIAAWLFAGAGLACLIAIAVLVPSPEQLKPALLLAFALLAFGGGEILNHPHEKVLPPPSPENQSPPPSWQRRRNTCALGNLGSIVAIILFFCAIAAMPGFR
jgi:hypothetical protein